MKVLQVVPGIGVEASGPSYSVPFLCRALRNAGADVELHILEPRPSSVCDLNVHAYPRHSFPHPALGRSPEMRRGLREHCRNADIIHNNSLWMLPNIYPASAIQGLRCQLVTAPRGTLAQWSLQRASWRKKLIGYWGQYRALNATAMFHATSYKEYEEIRRAGFLQPVMIVPIGMQIPSVFGHCPNTRRKLLFFGRLHEVKAIDHLLRAWNNVASMFPEWELEIAGPDAGVLNDLLTLEKELKIPRVLFSGEKKGQSKYELLATADLCVLPSKTENFGVTVAEAMACGVAVAASQGTPWGGLEHENAGWWFPIGIDSLTRVLKEALACPPQTLITKGENGRRWMIRDFAWQSIGEKTMAAYRWLLNEGEKPECVIIQ